MTLGGNRTLAALLAVLTAAGLALQQGRAIDRRYLPDRQRSQHIGASNDAGEQAVVASRADADKLTWLTRKAALTAGPTTGQAFPSGIGGARHGPADPSSTSPPPAGSWSLVSLHCLLTI